MGTQSHSGSTKPSTSKVRTTKKKISKPEVFAPRATGGQAQFAHFLPAANRIPAESVVSLSIGTTLLPANIAKGVGAVLEDKALLVRELPSINLALIESLPDLASAVVYAADRVVRTSATPAEVTTLKAEARSRRKKLLKMADVFVLDGVFPQDAIAKIHSGRGPIKAARDLMALAALYQEHASEIQARAPITEAEVEEAGALGMKLLGILKPGTISANPNLSPATAAALDARDRLFTLLVQRHNVLARAGTWLFGLGADSRVPALGSHVRRAKKANATTSPAGSTTPAQTSTATTAPTAAEKPSSTP